MLKNPNAIAAWIASHVVIAAEAIAQHYFHRQLPGFWQQELGADAVTVVLYVGRNGVKAALLRAWTTAKSIWAPPAPAKAAAPAK